MKRVLVLAGLVGSAAAVPGAATAAVSPLSTGGAVATSTASTLVDAGRGIATFSLFDPATRRFRLAVSDGKVVRRLGPTSRRVFDASVGVDASGRTVVTYSRCRKQAPGTDDTTYAPYWPGQAGCRIQSVDVASGRVRTLSVEKIRGQTLWLPVQAGRSLAYGRLLDRGVRRVTVHPKGGSSYRDRIHRYRFEVVRQDHRGRTHVLRGGPLANVGLSQENAQDLGGFGAGVTSLDFDGRRTAYSWGYRSEGCPIEHGAENPYASTVYLETGRQRTKLARSCTNGPAGFLSSVDLVGSAAAWLHLTPGTSANLSTPFIGRGGAGLGVSETPVAAPAPMSVLSSSVDGQTRWYVLTDGDQVSINRATAGP